MLRINANHFTTFSSGRFFIISQMPPAFFTKTFRTHYGVIPSKWVDT